MTWLARIARSYRARLILGYALVAAVFALAWGWSLAGPLGRSVLDQQTRSLTAVAQAGAFAASENASAAAVAKRLGATGGVRVTIVAPDGVVLADSQANAATMENHSTRPEVAAALAGRTGVARRRSATEGTEQLYVAVPATIGGSRVVLRVSEPLASIDAIVRTSRRVGIALLVLAFAVAVTVASWASNSALRPVMSLSGAAQRMAQGDLSSTVPEVPADLQPLATALEALRIQMRTRIDSLEAERATLTTVLDGLADAVFLLDGDKVRFANEAASHLFQPPVGGWRDVRIGSQVLPASLSAVICEHIGDDSAFTTEIGPDPRGTTLRVICAPVAGGSEDRVLVVVSDITERAQLERVRRDFVANASHELKTPVAAIQLLAESAETAANDGDMAVALEFARQIGAEASRLRRLVTDLLDLSRLEGLPSAGAVTNVRSAVGNALAGHAGAAGRKELDLAADWSAVRDIDVFVTAEPTDVAIALDNLLDNAISYTSQGSVRISVTATQMSVTIAVADTGPGIAEEHLPRIFERFYRVDRARSRESGGTGLGLSLVRHVVERNGGSVAVRSQVAAGSTFEITLPRAT